MKEFGNMRELIIYKTSRGVYQIIDTDSDAVLANYIPNRKLAEQIELLMHDGYIKAQDNNPALVMLEKLTYKPDQGAK